MAKAKTVYFCQSCGAQSPKWMGRCPNCGEWNTFVEEVMASGPAQPQHRKESPSNTGGHRNPKPRPLKDIRYHEEYRLLTGDSELDRTLGGGIVPGSLVLVGGEPGIGKSTLMLQLALRMKNQRVLYVSGEESEQQIKMRADRLADHHPDCFLFTETQTQNLFKQAEQLEPDILVVDSIQTMQSAFVESGAGSVSQVRECTAELLKFAKESGTPVFLVGHITKEGHLAGPKVLEHMVDTVLQFEGETHLSYRILRTLKNRFGSTSELGIYEMRSEGMRPVQNPSEILISQKDEGLSGVAICSSLEGNRPLLIELQSLVSLAAYGTPQRSSTGYDRQRLNMLLAVLEKRCGYRLGAQDVFLNIAGGLRMDDPALDLAVCASIVSSFTDFCIADKYCFAGEVGLGGEIRAINRIENRIAEADKLGFEQIFVSKYNVKGLDLSPYRISVRPFGKLEVLFQELEG